MAGRNRGSWFVPDAGDEVLVVFEAGDVEQPFVIGSLWNSTNPPPMTVDKNNNKKCLCSRNGVKITVDDQAATRALLLRRQVAKESRSRMVLALSRLRIATAIQ